ncbi:oxalyl-CoA decarboxylase [Streptomyces griseorubiginosus]|uniref:oxalyl-CoA decarboxylase n=1 Tax=Streptomyces griseorubiginosus TaxID=67304 RepID=UPI002E8196E3|nr:oxalyl-CoA decarboxylase [Streptomyces griseorubiginosus]WUB43169.1 oxalyl-CoA decarboxylase [Streptomyces griseorubiginosus]WUB51687.1 oxalyl-CoA decarboxylase [Streptomyces griseorubiginosus]
MTAPSTLETAAAADVPTELTDGYHLVVDALKLNDVDTIYGVVGIPITDLARLAQAQGIRYIGFRHESNAGHAAAIAGYLNKKPGVALTVSAPGFLNGLVALANATTNCFPMVQISGSSERHLVDLKQGDYEEMDQLAAAQPFVKAAYRVSRVEDIGRGIARALRTAISGRPGGVYLDIPAAVLGAIMPKAEGDRTLSRLVDPAPRQLPAPEAVDRAIELLASAERPLIVLGKGAAYAQADAKVRQFVESTGIPYVPMSMAKGLLPDDHPQSAATARSLALKKADVVMLIGARLNWLLGHGRTGWNPDAKFVQIDIDPKEMDSNQPISAPLVGDIESVLDALAERTKPGQIQAPSAWREELGARSAQNVAKMARRLEADPHPMQFMGALKAVRDVVHQHPETYIVNEGANALDIARNVIDMHVPRHRLDSGTWGVMGIGMGYAIAAAVESGAPVVAVEGDSAFGFSGIEIETICRYKLPVITVIMNNGGVYRGDDTNPYDDEPAPTTLMSAARHDLLIESFGGKGYRATTPAEVTAALTEALALGGPALIDCVIDPSAGTESGHISHLNPKGITVGNITPAKK